MPDGGAGGAQVRSCKYVEEVGSAISISTFETVEIVIEKQDLEHSTHTYCLDVDVLLLDVKTTDT